MFCFSLISEAKMRQRVTQVLDKTWTSIDTKMDRKSVTETRNATW
ncbi:MULTISPECIES: hypothetical protein [Chryseobacterium]|uniref:Uncharacterized protein n=1 Tax=Chryseobacterium geocarposphaerae TaxID=1416776 RepID=A0ABU1LEI7_9FLAO|nr:MULTISPECIES: hypothetical protein [Chryseobacterium]MDR6405124.1 hypothetical protein [Chryseobacterium geocarposphaerae]MDR6697907.1 hypothetical protein [Chryseobacterium ginsenosidimutans]